MAHRACVEQHVDYFLGVWLILWRLALRCGQNGYAY
jgi:hypothetical protein